MSKRVLVLVEGQTEERFVKDLLAPHFLPMDLYIIPTILVTKRVKDGPNFKGGVTSFARFEYDLNRLLNSSGDALVTTMIDYYRLPNDFPGMVSRRGTKPLERVAHVEREIRTHFRNAQDLSIHLTLHEFETFLFSSDTEVPKAMNQMEKCHDFSAIRTAYETPEDINERPGHAPSVRILFLFPSYRKTLHGPTIADRIGLDLIRKECPHFNNWIKEIEGFAAR